MDINKKMATLVGCILLVRIMFLNEELLSETKADKRWENINYNIMGEKQAKVQTAVTELKSQRFKRNALCFFLAFQ